MIPKADEVYLEFQKHINRYSNSQSTVHITHWQLLLSYSTQNTVGLFYIQCTKCC